MGEPLYVYFDGDYHGPVKTTEVRPGLMFDTAPDNRLIGIEVLDYERFTVNGVAAAATPDEALLPGLDAAWREAEASLPPGQTIDLILAKAFTLGVEWEMVRTLVRTGKEFCVYAIHTDNRRRISALLSRHGYHQQWNEGDDWSFVTTIREGTSHD